ncbi:CLUMA_CG012436, isoform A [Clunio marinus]|uniref:CLUMA_CG012313, isoform A n=1 Tax=Clunio marinus TaxID=568069 RepID=A0A1J1IER6_9DIPT|nr:CLUMA_CG012313, isoform A [Clunio marinus]CRK98767.1 CLUMA_CG012435, isoform A [Clunio marinus]CRK98769.1 CLUMA_CG012436, isoform A [Clunio marinus]
MAKTSFLLLIFVEPSSSSITFHFTSNIETRALWLMSNPFCMLIQPGGECVNAKQFEVSCLRHVAVKGGA